MADESLEIYNDASGSLEKRTQEQVQKSKYFYDLATKAEIIRWIAWKHFFDNEGHLDFGHTSKKSFILDEFDESVRSVEMKIQGVEPFAELLPIAENKLLTESGEAKTFSLENDLSDEEKDNLKIINQIGLSKWRLFSRDEHADFSKTISDGVVTFNDGREDVDLDEILSTSFRDWDKKFKEERKKYQKRIANLEEDKEKAEGERDHYKSQLEKNQDKIDRAIELESQFGKDAARMEEIDFNMQQAETALLKVERSFGKVDADKSTPEVVRERISSFLRSLNRIQVAAQERYPWLIQMDDIEEFPTWKLKDGDKFADLDDDVDPDFKPGEDV